MKTVVLTIVVLAIVAAGAGLLIMYSGVISVAADYPDNALVGWVLNTTSDRSEAHHASGKPTVDLTASDTILTGAGHFKEMCVVCHGYPGGERSEISQGLNPQPPDLKDAGSHWPPNRIFWVVKHGVRMTAMPAFGKTHTDQQIWDIVAFVKKYPSLTPEAYQKIMKKAPHVD